MRKSIGFLIYDMNARLKRSMNYKGGETLKLPSFRASSKSHEGLWSIAMSDS